MRTTSATPKQNIPRSKDETGKEEGGRGIGRKDKEEGELRIEHKGKKKGRRERVRMRGPRVRVEINRRERVMQFATYLRYGCRSGTVKRHCVDSSETIYFVDDFERISPPRNP